VESWLATFLKCSTRPITDGCRHKLYVTNTFTANGHGVILAADRIVRDKFVIHLEGNVEIKLRPSSPNQDVMVLHADEADYVRRTDEIVPRGNVRVIFELPK
jgi:hypothetical protein